MRISTSQIYRTGLDSMQRAQQQVTRGVMEMASGKRILSPSDDPSGATTAARIQTRIKSTEQYQRNGDLARPRLEQTEVNLDALNNHLQRAKELVVAGTNGTHSTESRGYIAAEIRQIRNAMYEIANSRDANGEYVFAGTNSLQAPFKSNGVGKVSYVGAEGVGAVRELAISDTWTLPIGETGADVFMKIPERSGMINEASTQGNTGTLTVKGTGIVNIPLAQSNAGKTFTISFSPALDSQTPPQPLFEDGKAVMQYSVTDDSDGTPLGSGRYSDGMSIEFGGRRVILSGDPNPGDRVESRPARFADIFSTLDEIATVFEQPLTDDDSRKALSIGSSIALSNLAGTLSHFDEIRANVGFRLQTLDNQTDLNQDRLIQLKTSRSEIEDLDYAEAISRFKLHETALQAAQQTYAQVNKLSLFNFI